MPSDFSGGVKSNPLSFLKAAVMRFLLALDGRIWDPFPVEKVSSRENRDWSLSYAIPNWGAAVRLSQSRLPPFSLLGIATVARVYGTVFHCTCSRLCVQSLEANFSKYERQAERTSR